MVVYSRNGVQNGIRTHLFCVSKKLITVTTSYIVQTVLTKSINSKITTPLLDSNDCSDSPDFFNELQYKLFYKEKLLDFMCDNQIDILCDSWMNIFQQQ